MEEAQRHQRALDAFLRSCGVTVDLAEVPQNRFQERVVPDHRAMPADSPDASDAGDPVRHRVAAPSIDPPVAFDPASGDVEDAAVHAAREAARTAPSLDALYGALRAFEGCPLKALAQTTCHGEGPQGAALMLVGEAPGRDEDEAGRPFVGRSGQLLEKMLAAIGLTREECYITNVIAWRPPANRTPSPIETATCEVFVRREIELVRPRVLVALGGAAAKTLFRNDTGIMRQRGRWVRFESGSGAIDAIATFHPAYVLRSPAEKRRVWQDLLAVKRRLAEGVSDAGAGSP